jgi:nucleoside diphosphate-linked moiety X motif 19, mitochondrial
LKRANKMKVAPSFNVFPGGKYDEPVDGSRKWLEVFGLNEDNSSDSIKNRFFKLFGPNTIGKNYLFAKDKQALSAEITYRLCAIRETFEETGLLFAKKKNKLSDCDGIDTSNIHYLELNQQKKWLHRVKNNANEFINLFLELELEPDLFGLYEWSNWITPIHEKRRFNTLFFTCFLNETPSTDTIIIDKDENDSFEVNDAILTFKYLL